MSFLQKLAALPVSRRFWAAVMGVVVVYFQDALGMSEVEATTVAGLLASWILGDSISQTQVV